MLLRIFSVNKWMVAESKKRVPKYLEGKVDFRLITANADWSIPNPQQGDAYAS